MSDEVKLNALFVKRRNQEELDFRKRDRNYSKATRENHFPTVLAKNSVLVYNKRSRKIDVDEKLRGIRTVNSKLFLLPF